MNQKNPLLSIYAILFVNMLLILFINTNAHGGSHVPFKSNEFIVDWLVCGPFPNEREENINTDFLLEHGGEQAIVPAEGMTHTSNSVPGGKVSWRWVRAEDSGKLDFTKYMKPNQKNVAYAAAFIQCKKDIRAFLKMGSNDRLKVWLNGKLIHFYPNPRASGPDADHILVDLRKGENLLLAKVDQEGANWWLYARFEELIAVNDQIYVVNPTVSSVPKRVSPTVVADIFSLLIYNAANQPIGDISLEVLKGRGRKPGRVSGVRLDAKQLTWLFVESEVDLTKTSDRLSADLVLSVGTMKKKFKVRTKRRPFIDGTVYLVAGFHVDPVWRDSQAGYQALSFSNLNQYLRAMEADPDYQVFLHEIPYLKPYYDAFPEDRALIRQLIEQGRIGTGGSYNQPNETTISGEAFIRNILYGRLFHENVLGDFPRAYAPWDVFGHIIQLPQLLAKSEFIGTAYTRSNYRDPGVPVPDVPDLYYAVAPDGSKLLTRKVDYGFDWRGETYNMSLSARNKVANSLAEQQRKIPGVNYDFILDATDEKQPTTWMIGKCADFKTYIPEVRLRGSGTADYFKDVAAQIEQDDLDVPQVTRDVSQYNEGCELSRFDLKSGNRLAENTIITAEKFATIANLFGAEYPADKLDKAWRQLLYGQHHDGITGCGADVPYLDLTAAYHEALELSANSLRDALGFIGKCIDTRGDKDAIPLIIFNPLNWQRDDLVRAEIKFSMPVNGFEIVDDKGNAVVCVAENIRKKSGKVISAHIQFFARQLPSFGYRTFWVKPTDSLPPSSVGKKIATHVVENDFFRVTVDENYGGGITSLIDKSTGKEYINLENGHPGNELILLKEGDGFEPAWRFITTGKKMFSKDAPCTIDVYENPLCKRIVVTGQMERMKKRVQEIILYNDKNRIDFRTALVDYFGLKGRNISEVDKHDDRDLFVIGFPAKLKGAVPVLEDRFATKTYYQSKEYLSYHSTNREWTSHHAMNSCYQWIDYSYSVRIHFGDAHSIALGPAEILTPKNKKERRAAFRLQEALGKRGVTSTPGYDSVQRDYDIQYRRFSFSIGAKDENRYNQQLLERMDKSVREAFEQRLQQNGYAYLFVHDTDLPEAWFDLPVLMIVGTDEQNTVRAVEELISQLAAGADINLPVETYASNKISQVPEVGMAIINRGNMAVSIEPEGTMVLALMHTVPWQSPLLKWTHDFPERKTHLFEYALQPHEGNWRKANLVRSGYEFNNPLLAIQARQHTGELPSAFSFIETTGEKAVITALKPKTFGNEAFTATKKTDVGNGVVLRFYESEGMGGEITIRSGIPLRKAQRINLMERNAQPVTYTNQAVTFSLGANSIETMLINFEGRTRIEKDGSSANAPSPTSPVYRRFWEHNKGAAPVGYLPVNVRLVGKIDISGTGRAQKIIQQLKVAICNDYIDKAVTGTVKIYTPRGMRAVPGEIKYSVAANSEQLYPVAIVFDNTTPEPGFIRASLESNGRTIFDVLEVGLPEKTFGHAETDQTKGLRLDWQIERLDNGVRVHITNPFEQTIDGDVELIGPVETWGLAEVNPVALMEISPWRQSFSVPAKGSRELEFTFLPLNILGAEDIAFWVVAKLSYFGYVDYKSAVGNLEIK